MKKIMIAAGLIFMCHAANAQDGCSNWRYQVKTLTDDAGIDWDSETPKETTLAELTYSSTMAFEPVEMEKEHAKMERLGSEKELVALSCYVYEVKTNYKDGEYHLFLSSRKDGTGKQMDAKIPSTDCKGIRRYGKLRIAYDKARQEAEAIKTWTDAGYVVKVELTGVPFRNFEYESRDNVYSTREIHPVLTLKAHLPKE